MRIGTFLPTSTPDPTLPILGDIGAAARHAENLGLDSIWATDHLIASAPMVESTVTLATAAALTERIHIGYGVLLLALRPVSWAAKQISALQYVSGNRLLLGIGTGNPAHGDIAWRATGLSYADRGRDTDEALRLLPDLIAGNSTTLPDGTGITLSPGTPVPPILVAGDVRRAKRRAAEFADSWIAMGLGPEDVAAVARELAELATEFGRPAPAVSLVVSLPEDLAAARERRAAYAEAGVDHLIVAPRDADWRSGYEFVAAVR